jgi:hypothetical protein
MSWRKGLATRYRRLHVKTIDLESIRPERAAKVETPRQLAIRERDEEIRAALNEAATIPSSQAIAIELKPDQKLATLRAAVRRVMSADHNGLNVAVRGTTIYLSKGAIPGARGRPRKS